MEPGLKIKICGMRDRENLQQVCRLGPDMVGYIFYRGSKRYVGNDPDPKIFEIPGTGILKTGVFVNEIMENVQRNYHRFRLDLVQLHGDEPPDYCSFLAGAGIPVVKAMDPGKINDRQYMESYAGAIRYFLFDTPGKGYGGTGRQFDWDRLQDYELEIPFLLGGGIGPGDADRLLDVKHSWLVGIDLNSRFESVPGLKSVQLLEPFLDRIRNKEI